MQGGTPAARPLRDPRPYTVCFAMPPTTTTKQKVQKHLNSVHGAVVDKLLPNLPSLQRTHRHLRRQSTGTRPYLPS